VNQEAAAQLSEEKGQPGSMGFFAGLTRAISLAMTYATNSDFTKKTYLWQAGYKNVPKAMN